MPILFKTPRYFLLLTVLLMSSFAAGAETLLWGGRPEFGIELEQEKTPDKLGVTNSITYIPSLSFPNGPVNRIDVLIMDEREKALPSGPTEHITKLAVRVRKNIRFGGDWGMYVRALVGRASEPGDAYI